MRNQAFEQFTTTVGTNGTMLMPILDAHNAGIPCLQVGPGYRRIPIRFYCKMPDSIEVERLPAPVGADRSSVTFDVLLIVLTGMLAPHCTAEFTRILGAEGQRGKLTKIPLHRWAPQQDTTIYPAATVQMPTLRPGETMELEGVSHWYNPRKPTRGRPKRQSNPFVFDVGSEPPPEVLTKQPIQLQTLVKLKWLPLAKHKKKFRVVKGTPFQHGHVTEAMSMGDFENGPMEPGTLEEP